MICLGYPIVGNGQSFCTNGLTTALHERTYNCLYNAVEIILDFVTLSPHPEPIITLFIRSKVSSYRDNMNDDAGE